MSYNRRSFFIYLLDSGVSLREYTALRPLATYMWPEQWAVDLWPEQWAAYIALCRLTGTKP
ncbi:hypothetical protein V6O07_19815, partial [Arthrospira platensis SPKY2]